MVEYASGLITREATLTIAALVEPRLLSAGSHAKVRIDACVDDQGRSMLIPGEQIFTSREGEGLNVPLRLRASQAGTVIRSLNGEFSVTVGPPSQMLAIPDLTRGDSQSLDFDGITVSAGSPRAVRLGTPAAVSYWVDFRIDVDPELPYAEILQKAESLQIYSGLSLYDDNRGIIRKDALFNEGRGSLRPIDGRRPAILTWQTPQETRWHKVAFELRDIPVPKTTR